MDYKQLNEYCRTAIQGIGGLGAFALALIAWKNFKLIQNRRKLPQEVHS